MKIYEYIYIYIYTYIYIYRTHNIYIDYVLMFDHVLIDFKSFYLTIFVNIQAPAQKIIENWLHCSQLLAPLKHDKEDARARLGSHRKEYN